MSASPQDLHGDRFRANPDDRAAFEMLEEHLFMQADWAALADLYRRRQAAPSLLERPRARAELTMRLGQLYEDRLGDAEAAIRSYTEAVRLDPTRRRALRSLRRIYAQRRSWEAVLQIGEQEAALAESGEDRARIYAEMGDIWQREIGDREQAEDLYARARIESGGALPAEPPAAADAEPDAACDFIEPTLALAPDDPRSQSAHSQLDEEQVALTMPEWDVTLDVGAQRSARVVGVLERKLAAREAEGAGDSPAATALRLRIAELRSGPLGDPARAIEVLEPATAHDAARREVAPMLAGLYEQLGRIEPLIAIAERSAESCDDRAARIFWWRRAAEAARAIGDSPRAIACLRQLLADRPHDRGARSALIELHRSRGEAEPLVALLREELLTASGERELELQTELATWLGEAQGDAEGAIAHWRRCVELEPERGDLVERALVACGARGGPLAQLDLLDHAADRATSDAARASLLARRGALLADALAWQDEAALSWRAALALDPQQPLARERMQAVAGS